MKCVIWFFLVVGCLFAVGCRQQEQRDAAEESVRTKLRQLHESMNNGCVGITKISAIGGVINDWISSVSNASHRTGLAIELSDAILSVDLTNQPYKAFFTNGTGYAYSPRDGATTFYPEFVNATCWIMKEHGCSSRAVMEFFFKALRKYRDASFGIPLGIKRLPGETHEIASARYNCARGAYAFYVETMSQIRRPLLPDRPPIFYVPPPELQDEFKRRLEPFFEFPSKDEFYNYLLPGIKRPPPDPKKLEQKSRNDEVEVDI